MLTNLVIGIAVVIVVVIAVSAVVLLSQTPPDFDAIIKNADCDAALGLAEEHLEKATVQQQLAIGILTGGCIFAP